MKKLFVLFLMLLPGIACRAQFQEGLDPSFANKGIGEFDESIASPSMFYDGLVLPDGKIIAATRWSILKLDSDGSLTRGFAADGVYNEPRYFYDGSSYRLVPLIDLNILGVTLLLQPDGKIIAAGMSSYGGGYHASQILRFHPDGRPDKSFGRNGLICDTLLATYAYWKTAALSLDGKVVMAGEERTGGSKLAFARFTTDGKVDSSFGDNGKVFHPGELRAEKILVQPDGKMVVLFDYFGLGRFWPDGRPDSSFNKTGYSFIFGKKDMAAPFTTCMALRPDGKIWVAGHHIFGTPTTFVIGRFNADGSIDSSFNGVGYKTYATDTGDQNKLRQMVLQPGGKLVVAGTSTNRTSKWPNFSLMRINEDGREDSTFGINGRLMTQLNTTPSCELKKLMVQADGKLLALGWSENYAANISNSAIVRYHANGGTDIDEHTETRAVNVFPNPADHFVNITLPQTGAQYQVTLADMRGTICKKWMNVKNNVQYDISELPSGIYLLTISNQHETLHQKISILH